MSFRVLGARWDGCIVPQRCLRHAMGMETALLSSLGLKLTVAVENQNGARRDRDPDGQALAGAAEVFACHCCCRARS